MYFVIESIKTSHLDKFQECFNKINQVVSEYESGQHGSLPVTRHYLHVYDKVDKFAGQGGWKKKSKAPERCFAMRCCTPSFLFSRIQAEKPISMLVTSGTLSPINSLEQELGIPLILKLSCQHVVQREQVITTVLGSGITDQPFNFSYASRNNPNLPLELGNTIADICSKVKGGVLIFFPSYALMKEYTEKWAFLGVTAKLKKQHKIFLVED